MNRLTTKPTKWLYAQWVAKHPSFLHWAHTHFVGFVMSRFIILMKIITAAWNLSHDMIKPTKWGCASAQSDQSLRCPHEESLGPQLPIERTAKTLIRLGRCPGWSESLLGAYSLCWFCHVTAYLCEILGWEKVKSQFLAIKFLVRMNFLTTCHFTCDLHDVGN